MKKNNFLILICLIIIIAIMSLVLIFMKTDEPKINYTEDEMNENTIKKILNDVFSVHLQNANEIDYLEKYYKGYQPIIGKTKEILRFLFPPNSGNDLSMW